MARIRSLKPETPHDLKLASVHRDARLTFVWLLTQADDDGLVRGAPRQLLGQLFPYDKDVDEVVLLDWIRELVSIGVVRWRRTRDGTPVVEIVNWLKHQRIVNRGKPGLAATLTQDEAGPPVIESSLDPNESLTRPVRESRGADREQGSRGKGEGKVATRIGPSEKPPLPAWVAEAHAIYSERIGLLPHGRIGAALKSAVQEYGWETVKRWFTAYCDARPYRRRDGSIFGDLPGDNPSNMPPRNTDFMGPEDFVKNLTTWKARCAPMVPR